MKFIFILSLMGVFFSNQTMAQEKSAVPENWYCDGRWKAYLIFTGTVLKVENFKELSTDQPLPPDFKNKFDKTITFKAEKIYKGGSKDEMIDAIEVSTFSQNKNEPLQFKEGEKYLVYVEREGVIPIAKSWIYVNAVMSNGLTAPFKQAAETIAFLEKVHAIDFDPVRDALGFKGTEKVFKGGIISGKARNLVRPPYPKEAKEKKISGTIQVWVLIDETGKVILAKASCPFNQQLAAASEQAALASMFTPVIISEKPVKVAGVIVYNFVP